MITCVLFRVAEKVITKLLKFIFTLPGLVVCHITPQPQPHFLTLSSLEPGVH